MRNDTWADEHAFLAGPSIENNLLKVNIYFTSLNVNKITEKPRYSVRLIKNNKNVDEKDDFHCRRLHFCNDCLQFADSSLIFAVGGCLSIYLGISVVMIFEVSSWAGCGFVWLSVINNHLLNFYWLGPILSLKWRSKLKLMLNLKKPTKTFGI